MEPRAFLRHLFDEAVAAASPARCVPPHLPPPPKGRTLVVGAGKAAAAMARAVEAHWQGALSGLVITRYGHGVPCRHIEVVEAGHPVPDAAGRDAARRIVEMVSQACADDLVLCLLSGGGSALMAVPAPGVTLEEKQAITRALLKSGAAIAEINCVRKHLSAVKGGRLALATRARIVSLIISDVPGDDPSIIASGPTVADPTTREDARAILQRYGIASPAWLNDPASETPKLGNAAFARVENHIIAAAKNGLAAAARAAETAGLRAIILGDAVEGEAREVARAHATLALVQDEPVMLLSGGETTVTVTGAGRGGRNSEYALALALALGGAAHIHALACDTDGIDGTEDNAGATVTPDTLVRAHALGLDAAAHLARNDAYTFFQKLGDLVVTGPTRTNINDFRAIWVAPTSSR